MGNKRSAEVYRVVAEDSEYRLSGHRNATGLYTTLKGARQERNREQRFAENRNRWRQSRGEEPKPVPVIKIQKAVMVWEDVE